MNLFVPPWFIGKMGGEDFFVCLVCHDDGKKTARLTLSCGHQLCLPCYTHCLHTQETYWTFDVLHCPSCKKEIITQHKPNAMHTSILFGLVQTAARCRRKILNKEVDIAAEEQILERQLSLIKERTKLWGLYEKYEKFTHLPEATISQIQSDTMKSLPTYSKMRV